MTIVWEAGFVMWTSCSPSASVWEKAGKERLLGMLVEAKEESVSIDSDTCLLATIITGQFNLFCLLQPWANFKNYFLRRSLDSALQLPVYKKNLQ